MSKFANLSSTGLRKKQAIEDEDPMASLANLADCMLVMACGLMVALAIAWNIDLTNVTEVEMTENKTEIKDVRTMEGKIETGGSSFVDIGRVYQDPETGTYYVVEKESEEKSK